MVAAAEEEQQQNNGGVPVIPSVQIVINEATSIIAQPSVSEGASSGNQSVKSLKKTKCSVKKARTRPHNTKANLKQSCCLKFFIRNPENNAGGAASETLQVPPLISENGPSVEESQLNGALNTSPNSTFHKQKKKDIRRKNEDSLAMVFMIIILIFLVCHAPRIILDINELATIKMSEYCASVDKYQYSFWSIIVLNISHFLLVVNSSVNMIVYCLLGSRFRAEVKKIMDNIVCWIHNYSNAAIASPQTNPGNVASNNNAWKHFILSTIHTIFNVSKKLPSKCLQMSVTDVEIKYAYKKSYLPTMQLDKLLEHYRRCLLFSCLLWKRGKICSWHQLGSHICRLNNSRMWLAVISIRLLYLLTAGI